MRYSLTRSRENRIATWSGLTLRELGQQVAFCATDNLGMTRQEATREGMAAEQAFKAGEGYKLADYSFSAVSA